MFPSSFYPLKTHKRHPISSIITALVTEQCGVIQEAVVYFRSERKRPTKIGGGATHRLLYQNADDSIQALSSNESGNY